MGTLIESEIDAYLLFERLRWSGEPGRCPHCGVAGRCHFLRPANGLARRTRTGAASVRRVWKCSACRRQFSVLTGTVFEGTKLDLRIWVAIVCALADGQRVPSAPDIARRHGIATDTARHVLARLTAAGLPPRRP